MRTFDETIPPFETRLPKYTVIPKEKFSVRTTPEVPTWDGMYVPGEDGATIDFDFEVEKAGRYQVNAVVNYFFTGGLYQASVDGQDVGRPRDYSFRGEDTTWDSFDLHDFDPGTHTLRFKYLGTGREQRSMDPQHRALRVDAIMLLRLQDIGGYRAVHKRLLGKGKKSAD